MTVVNGADESHATVEVLVSTMNASDPCALVERMGLLQADVDVLVINQCTSREAPAPFHQDRIRMMSFEECGLSRSRNHGLTLSRGDIVVLADDDVRYVEGFDARMREAYADYPSADAITFRFAEANSQGAARRYPRDGHWHNRFSLGSVASVEITGRRTALTSFRFDERFGLGSLLPQGEEAVFLIDALRRGLRMRFEPITLCEHQGRTSGQGDWDEAMACTKGAVLRRAYPRLWSLLCIWFAMTKRRRYAPGLGVAAVTRALFRGALRLAADRQPLR